MNRTPRPWRVAAALTGALLTLSGASDAQSHCPSQPESDALEVRGNAHRIEARDDEALALFQRSDALCHGASARLRVGLAEAALGRWVEAERDVAEALSRRDDPWIVANRARAEAQLQNIRRHLDIERAMERVASAQSAPAAPAGPVALVAPAPVDASRDLTAPFATGSTQRTLGTVAAVGAGVVLAAGVAALVVRSLRVDAFNSHCQQRAGVATERPQSALRDCQGLYDEGSTMESVAIGALATGASLAVASGLLFLTAPRRRERPSAAVSCGLGPGTVGLACGATF